MMALDGTFQDDNWMNETIICISNINHATIFLKSNNIFHRKGVLIIYTLL